jgi:hypothetical protein
MKIQRLALAAFGFVIVYNLLFYQTPLNLGIGFLFGLLNVYFLIVHDPESQNISLGVVSSVIATLFAFLFAFRANEVTQVIDLLTALFFSLTALYFYKQPQEFSYKITSLIGAPLSVLGRTGAGISRFLKGSKPEENHSGSTAGSWFNGLLMATPIFLLLLGLLWMADPIFGKLAGDFFATLGERTVVSLIIFITISVLGLSYFICQNHQEEPSRVSGNAQELMVVLGSIVVLFTVFLGVQFRYLFTRVSELELHQLGIASLTYSEYVRKGFFELLIVGAISSGVILFILRSLHHIRNGSKIWVQFFSVTVVVETALLLLSAGQRLALYANTHGLTRARIYGFFFLIWLAAILGILLVRVIREFKTGWLFALPLAVTLEILLLLNLANVDGLIAKNFPPTVNKEVDYYYLTNLSVDAKASWIESVNAISDRVNQMESNGKLSEDDYRKLYWDKKTMGQLEKKLQFLKDKYGPMTEINWKEKNDSWLKERSWQAFNLSEYNAYQEMSQNKSLFAAVAGLEERMNKLDASTSSQLKTDVYQDRSARPPLVR